MPHGSRSYLAGHSWDGFPSWRPSTRAQFTRAPPTVTSGSGGDAPRWWWTGYTLAYSRAAGKSIGDFENIGLGNVAAVPSIVSAYNPEILSYLLFSSVFFRISTAQIMICGTFEHGSLFPRLQFGFIWASVVYSPLACVLDSIRAMYATFSTNIAASCGLIGCATTDYFKKKEKLPAVGASQGAIAALIGISVVVCSPCEDISVWICIDEGGDAFKPHGIGGVVGALPTGISGKRIE
ncbi:hypothetical protein C7212DRAFT_347482 [Tuber magnatum]|uniref:Ammonium transporter AmtB-like domain-containing protein n=1 Tax=Tuber magnatum TaxID=42249 RepID=A0A317SF52_9PEZI|nr:hypothetical protein C7212DRAFT_347482 [Tuber magnatum]